MATRNIVLIIGNGFDLDLGLKTSYKDFWGSSFCPKNYPAPLIRHLNSYVDGDSRDIRWFDFENELLNYALRGDKSDVVNDTELHYIRTHEDYKLALSLTYGVGDDYDVFKSLIDKGFIEISMNNIGVRSARIPYREDYALSSRDRDMQAFLLIKSKLREYFQSLSYTSLRNDSVSRAIVQAVKKAKEKGDSVDLFSFNYTPFYYSDKVLDDSCVHHIHGDYQNNIILGTRDDVALSRDYDFVQKSSDPNYEASLLYAKIDKADEIIIFGHSLGDSDSQYFMSFLSNIVSSRESTKRITIFTKDNTSESEIKRSLKLMTSGKLLELINRTGLRFFKTVQINSQQSEMKQFLMRFFDNETTVETLIGKLLLTR